LLRSKRGSHQRSQETEGQELPRRPPQVHQERKHCILFLAGRSEALLFRTRPQVLIAYRDETHCKLNVAE
jgi:hypothetical protein